MRMEFDQFVNELPERKPALRADDETRFGLDHHHTASGTSPGTTNARRQGGRARRSRSVDEAFFQPAFKVRRESHVTTFTGELAVVSPPKGFTAFWAIHPFHLRSVLSRSDDSCITRRGK
jgi:hypothetical protein